MSCKYPQISLLTVSISSMIRCISIKTPVWKIAASKLFSHFSKNCFSVSVDCWCQTSTFTNIHLFSAWGAPLRAEKNFVVWHAFISYRMLSGWGRRSCWQEISQTVMFQRKGTSEVFICLIELSTLSIIISFGSMFNMHKAHRVKL